jgi:hypothetical protein
VKKVDLLKMSIKDIDTHKQSKLIAIFGDRGSGKSVLNSRFVLRSSLPFFSNYHVFADKQKTKPYNERIPHPRYNELNPEDLFRMETKPAIISITEAYEFFESRLGMGSFQRYMSYMVFQSRKARKHFIIDTQLDDTIDHRFTRLCDYIIVSELENWGFHYYLSNKRDIVEFGIKFKDAEKFWDYYDSWEIVTTPQIENLGEQIGTLNKPKLKEKLKQLEKRFKEEFGELERKKITHGLVETFLLEAEESDVYESYLYAKLQRPLKAS